MSEKFDFDIRYSEMTDLPFLQQWIVEPNSMKWFPISSEKEMEDYTRNWIGFSRYQASLTATHLNIPCAIGTLFLMPYRKVAHECMIYLIVDPSHRKKGVGSSLLKNLLNLAENYFRIEGICVEIYEGCPAIPLFKKQGFRTYAEQKHFVKDNDQYMSRVLMDYFFKDQKK